MATDSSGNSHVAWRRSNGSNQIVQYVKIDSSGTPGTVEDLSATGQSAYNLHLTTDSSGNSHVVWRRSNGSNFIIQYRGEVNTPSNSTAPSISGTAEVGNELTCSNGSWDGRGDDSITYSYQWNRDSSAISGATSSAYTLTSSDAGTTITCTVTATNFAGSTSATSQGVECPAATVNQPVSTPALSFYLTTPSFNMSDRVKLKRSTLFRRYLRTGFKGNMSGYSRIEAYLLRVKYTRTKGKGNATSGRKKLCYKVHRPKKSVPCDTTTTNGVTTDSSGSLTIKPLGSGKRARAIRRGLNNEKRIRKGKYDLTIKAYPTSGGAAHTYTYRFKIT